MMGILTTGWFAVLLLLLLFHVAASSSAPFPSGANCLFIGHSFFIPIAGEFNELAEEEEQSLLIHHSYQQEFSGGQSGGPGPLWEDDEHRATITSYLSTGSIDLFGLTVAANDDGTPSGADDYVPWIDLALSYNPNTTIFIGMPWIGNGAPSQLTTAEFTSFLELAGPLFYAETIMPLRDLYPSVDIYYLHYGLAASIMREMYDEEELVGITSYIGFNNPAALFSDVFGHAGPMLEEVCALVWYELFYGGDRPTHGWDVDTVETIVTQVMDANRDYNSDIGDDEDNNDEEDDDEEDGDDSEDEENSEDETSVVIPFEAFTSGIHGLYIGHSFFVPIARVFDDIAELANTANAAAFPDHVMEEEFSGGATGAPGALWNDTGHFFNINASLATGEIDLFGLTGFSGEIEESFQHWLETGDYLGAEDGSVLSDYTQWIDLALSYNSNTSIFIGIPWVTNNSQMNTTYFNTLADFACGAAYEGLVLPLREMYPSTPILYVCYGKTAAIMRQKFDDGTLPDITRLVGFRDNALFTDANLGHAGNYLKDMCAVLWLRLLYGASDEQLRNYILQVSPWNRLSTLDVLEQVIAYNEPYMEFNTTTSGTSTTPAPTTAPTSVPTEPPTDAPTNAPTNVPTDPPTNPPTDPPTNPPTDFPTDPPTDAPTNVPTNAPTTLPTSAPTTQPITPAPSISLAPSTSQAPTLSPTTSIAPSTSQAPTVEEEPVFCLSGQSLVQTRDHGMVQMKDVTIGDYVLVDNDDDNYEPIYSFLHYEPSRQDGIKYLKLLPSGLEISSNHLLHANGRFVPASQVQVGDWLSSVDDKDNEQSWQQQQQQITEIQTITRQGAFAPLTSTGTLVVNGVLVSNYAYDDKIVRHLPLFVREHYHEWAHAVVAMVLRWQCPRGICHEETYTAEGISVATQYLRSVTRWIVGFLPSQPQRQMVRGGA